MRINCPAGACMGAALAIFAGAPALAETRTFSISAGPLRPALDEWARQAGSQILYRAGDLGDARTSGVHGKLNADAALEELLAGTGFGFRRDPSGAVAIIRKGPIKPAEAIASDKGPDTPLDPQIVVTGTRLRNIEETASPITSYTREDIARAGRADLADFLAILPQNFSGGSYGLTPDGILGGGAQTFLNTGGATSPNLRGLGPGSTLTLVNGHRVAPSAGSAFVDIGIIPQGAIERIDIVADGASAVYGSDAVGGVVNIILRDRLDGAETDVNYELDGHGQYRNFEAMQSVGTDWGSGGALVSARYRKRGKFKTSERSFTDHVPGIDRPEIELDPLLYPGSREASFYGVVRQRLSGTVRGEIDGWASRRKQQQVVGGNFVTRFDTISDQRSINGSLAIKLAPALNANLSAGFANSHDRASQRDFTQGSGQIFFIAGKQDFDLGYAGANLGGELASLPAGDLSFSIGGEHRSEKFLFDFGGDFEVVRRSRRKINSAYGELLVPIVAPAMEVPLLTRASLAVAARYDDYSDVGDALTWKAGLLAAFKDLRLRSTFSTAFRAPNLNDLAQAGRLTVLGDPFTYYSPDRPGDFARVINILGFADLKPEKARIFTMGADFEPRSARGLKASATYFSYHYRDRLSTPPFAADILLRPAVFGGIFRPISSASEVEQILDEAEANGGSVILFDPSLPLSAYEYVIDMSFRNIAAQKVKGIDLSLGYKARLGGIAWAANAFATFILSDQRRISRESEPNEFAGLFAEQPEVKLRAELSAAKGPFSVTAAVGRISSFKNTNILGDPRIHPFTTVDLSAQFRIAKSPGGGSTVLGLGVRNLFNAAPPFVQRGADAPSYDPANANPLGRVLVARLSHDW